MPKANRREVVLQLLHEYYATKAPQLEARLVQMYIGLVRKQAWGYARSSSVPFDDLVQTGAIGLLKAIRGWRPEKQTSAAGFTCYAWIAIRHAILKLFCTKRFDVVEYQEPAPDRTPVPAPRVDPQHAWNVVAAAIGRLPEEQRLRYQVIIERRWLDDEPATFAELSSLLSVTRQRVQQLESLCRNYLQKELWYEQGEPPPSAVSRLKPGPKPLGRHLRPSVVESCASVAACAGI